MARDQARKLERAPNFHQDSPDEPWAYHGCGDEIMEGLLKIEDYMTRLGTHQRTTDNHAMDDIILAG